MNESKYELKPMDEAEIGYIREKLADLEDTVVPPRADAQGEEIILKISDADGTIIAGCIIYYKYLQAEGMAVVQDRVNSILC